MAKIKSINTVASQMAHIEGKANQARMGDIKELLAILCDLIADDIEVLHAITANAIRRRERKGPK